MRSPAIFVLFGTIAGLSFAYPQAQRSIELLAKNSSSGIFAHKNILFSAPTKSAPVKALEHVLLDDPTTIRPMELPTIFVTNPSLNELDSADASEENRKDFEEFSYETEDEPEAEKLRLKLCPDSPSGRQRQLFDQKERKCATVGEKAHCGNNMSFRYDTTTDTNFTSVYGYCECDYGKSTIPLVYHAETNACYFVYERAYCAPKEWLVFNGTGHALCEKKSCPSANRRKSRLIEVTVRLNGTGPCVKLNEPSEHCSDPSDTVHFRAYELFPKCGQSEIIPAPRMLSPIHQQRCSPGSFLSFSGRCSSAWAW